MSIARARPWVYQRSLGRLRVYEAPPAQIPSLPRLRYGRRFTTVTSETRDDVAFGTLQGTIHQAEIVLLKTYRLQRTHSELHLWLRALQRCHVDLSACRSSSDSRRRPRLAVYGRDENTVDQLVYSFLADPLSSYAFQLNQLLSILEVRGSEPFHIEYGQPTRNQGSHLYTQAPLLQKLSATVIRVPPGSLDHTDAFLAAHVPILVVNGPDFSLAHIPLPSNDRFVVVVNATPGPRLAAQIRDVIATKVGSSTPPHVIFVDIERAVQSFADLQAKELTAAAVEKYQDDHAQSRISDFFDTLQYLMQSDVSTLTLQTSQSVVHGAVRACDAALQSTVKDITALKSITEGFKEQIEVVEIAEEDNFLDGLDHRTFDVRMEDLEKDIQAVLNSLSWWKLPLRVDELTSTLTSYVEKALLKQIEMNLLVQTGRLSVLQTQLVEETLQRLSSIPKAFDSAVIRNDINRVTSSPEFQLSSGILTAPLKTRLTQLGSATSYLHFQAQKNLMASSALSLASLAGGYTSWMLHYLDGASATGAVALAGMAILNWALGNWDKGKRRWSQNWHRTLDGLERDLKATLKTVMDTKVLLVPRTAYRELVNTSRKSEGAVAAIRDELNEIETSRR